MPNINDLYESKYLKASDLKGREFNLTISTIQVEVLGSGSQAKKKPVVYFQGAQKGMALNRSNADEIANVYGLLTEDWIGKSVTLYPSTTRFADQVVPCIKIRCTRQETKPVNRPVNLGAPMPPQQEMVPTTGPSEYDDGPSF